MAAAITDPEATPTSRASPTRARQRACSRARTSAPTAAMARPPERRPASRRHPDGRPPPAKYVGPPVELVAAQPLADQIVRLSPSPTASSRPPQRLEYRPGQVVFEQGARSDLVYTVEEGEVEIVRQRTDGGVELLALLGPGRYFGELGPLFGLQRSATARAV